MTAAQKSQPNSAFFEKASKLQLYLSTRLQTLHTTSILSKEGHKIQKRCALPLFASHWPSLFRWSSRRACCVLSPPLTPPMASIPPVDLRPRGFTTRSIFWRSRTCAGEQTEEKHRVIQLTHSSHARRNKDKHCCSFCSLILIFAYHPSHPKLTHPHSHLPLASG